MPNTRPLLETAAYRRCADDRVGEDSYGVPFTAKLRKRLDRDVGGQLNVRIDSRTRLQDGATAGGAIWFADPSMLLRHLRDGLTTEEYRIKLADYETFRRISYTNYVTLFKAKGVRLVVLTVHTCCAVVRQFIPDMSLTDERAFLRDTLRNGAAFFRERHPSVTIVGYKVDIEDAHDGRILGMRHVLTYGPEINWDLPENDASLRASMPPPDVD